MLSDRIRTTSWQDRREIIYCKRAILSLSSSKILTPNPPLSREIGLPSYSKLSLYVQDQGEEKTTREIVSAEFSKSIKLRRLGTYSMMK